MRARIALLGFGVVTAVVAPGRRRERLWGAIVGRRNGLCEGDRENWEEEALLIQSSCMGQVKVKGVR